MSTSRLPFALLSGLKTALLTCCTQVQLQEKEGSFLPPIIMQNGQQNFLFEFGKSKFNLYRLSEPITSWNFLPSNEFKYLSDYAGLENCQIELLFKMSVLYCLKHQCLIHNLDRILVD